MVSEVVALPRLRGYQLEAWQAILDSALNGRGLTFSVVMARQAGKNELSARVELFLLLKRSGVALENIKCAPTFEPQCRISMNRLWKQIAQSGEELARTATREEGRAIRVGLARQLFLSAEESANVVGHTAGLLLEVDEAQDVAEEKFDREFRPMAAPTGATIVYYGTPWDDSTLLARAAETHRDLERRDGIRRHFEADWTIVARHNEAYRRFVEAERERLGENHPLFLTQYALRTISGGGRLFNGSQRAQLQGRHARQRAGVEGEVYVAGLDVGGQEWAMGNAQWAMGPSTELRTGNAEWAMGDEPFDRAQEGQWAMRDEHELSGWKPGRAVWPDPREGRGRTGAGHARTVLTVARVVEAGSFALVPEPRLEVVEHVAFEGTAHDQVFARLADLLGQVWRVRRVAVDVTGLGETLGRLLMRALGERAVQAFRFTAESKSRLGYGLLASVNGGRLKVYAGDGSQEYMDFWREMEPARASYRPSRQMNFYVDPSDGHDDYLMSLALAVEAVRELDTRPRIARGRVG